MKPPPLDYVRPGSVADAVVALGDEDAKVIAGGQSLLPLLALRLARPTVLVDIADLGLDDIRVEAVAPGRDTGPGSDLVAAEVICIGAGVRQRRIELDPLVATAVPLLAEAAAHVGYPSTRNRGTLGGSLAHADPVAELPAVAVALGGTVVAVGPTGARDLRCEELAEGWFETTLSPDELITEIRLPVLGGTQGAAWCEWSARAHDFAEAGVGITLRFDADGTCVDVRAAACGMGRRPLPLDEVIGAAGLLGATHLGATQLGAAQPGGSELAPALVRAVAAAVTTASGPAGEDRAELAGLLAGRAAARAWRRAGADRRVAA